MKAYYYYGETIPWDVLEYTEVKKKKVLYINMPVSFDIETSSFYEGDEQRAIMYHWQFCFGEDLVIMGRTWDEWESFIRDIRAYFHTYSGRRLIIYVHNLAYEFSFIGRRLIWDEVFSMDRRRPLYARSVDGLEFRCSYLLSGYNLATLANNLLWHDIKKASGDLDYSKIRHSKTPLTEKEIGYCVNDVKVVTAYIAERIQADGDISKIPYTKTGYVRNDCRNAVYGTDHRGKQYKNYRGLMRMLQLRPDEYTMLRAAFAGGFTHANAWYVGKVIPNVTSKDFTSSYPTVMIAEKFPMSRGVKCTPTQSEYLENEKYYCWCLDVEMAGVYSTILQEHYISLSRCTKLSKRHSIDNGRIASADYLRITITNIDFEIIRKVYHIDSWHIIKAYRYRKSYLPKNLILQILNYYEKKTTLKGIEDKAAEYLEGKERLNSIYGMCVTDILRDKITYNEGIWDKEIPDMVKEIEKDNKSRRRFLFYPWGVWVTAYARRNLWLGILECGSDYIYSDTDSIKCINIEDHQKWFSEYDVNITAKLEKALKYHGIPLDRIRPKTIEGKEKPLGVWDADGDYSRFKTLGAKRYMTEDANTGKLSLTVSGLNKKMAIPYLLEKYGKEKIFDAFDMGEPGRPGLLVPKGASGRQILTYIDGYTSGVVYDYNGNPCEYEEKSSVHMEEGTYEMNITATFFEYLQGFTEVNIQ